MSEKQFKIVLNLYDEYTDAFICLSDEIKTSFYERLYGEGNYPAS